MHKTGIPDGYLPLKGDVVLVEAVVKYDVDETEDIFLFDLDGYTTHSADISRIKSVVSMAFKVGDRVYYENADVRGTIVSLADGFAWVKGDNDLFYTCRTSSIVRTPKDDADLMMPIKADPPVQPPINI